MRLEQLQYVIAVAKCNSITKAAKQLFISQPSLSLAINNFEKELHIKIFNRTPEGVEVSEFGEIVIEKACRILNEVEEIQNMFSDTEPNLRGTITIATMPAMNNILLNAYTVFREKHPMVNIVIEEDDNLGTFRKARAGDIDLGIVGFGNYDRDITLIKTLDNRLKYEKLLNDEFLYYVSPDHDFLKDKQFLSNNKKYPVITYKNNWADTEVKEIVKFNASEIMRFNDFENIKKIISLNKAVGLLPGIVSWNDIYVSTGNIVPLKIADSNPNFEIGMIYNKEYIKAPLKKFISTFKTIVQDLIISPPVNL